MTPTLAWVLNLDADLELMDPAGDIASHRRRAQTEAFGHAFLESARTGLPMFEHVELTSSDPADKSGALCQAWCPTDSAVTIARARGLCLATSGMDVLRRVNHKAFGAALGDARFAWNGSTLRRLLAECERPALLKRPFGFSGRGQKRIDDELTGAAERWALASMRQYGFGLQVEPFRDITAEFALHGWLTRDGHVLRGQPTRMQCDRAGRWLRTEVASGLRDDEHDALDRALDRTALALHTAGYSGPFAIDAFAYQAGTTTAFRALSEINARYTMGFFTGMRAVSSALAERIVESQEIRPSGSRGFTH